MPTPENMIKTRLVSDEVQIGAWLGMGSAVATEIAGQAGYNWCMIDGEHGAYDLPSLRAQLITLAAANCPAGVRVAENEPWMIAQALDIGARTILVPMVNTVAEAQRAVQAAYFPPNGARGMASAVVRASGYGLDSDYSLGANRQTCLMVQAETQQAVENVDEIAELDGVECVFVGPSDLAADMGCIGDIDAPQVQEAIAHVLGRARAAGKGAAMFCLNPSDVAKYRDMGANFIAVASDVAAFSAVMRGRVAEVRNALGQP